MKRTRSVLQEAQQLVYGARAEAYGEPLDNHGCTAAMFAAYLERKHGIRVAVDAEDVCVFNILQKVSREAHLPARDNLVDGAGYFGNIERVRGERKRRAEGSI